MAETTSTTSADGRTARPARFGVNLMPRSWVDRPHIEGAELKAHRASATIPHDPTA